MTCFDDKVSDRPDGAPALSLAEMDRALSKIRDLMPPGARISACSLPWTPYSPFDRMPVIITPYSPEPVPIPLTRWERVRVWFERLVDGAELTPEIYPWPRVRRLERAGYLLFGRSLVMHPRTAAYFGNVVA